MKLFCVLRVHLVCPLSLPIVLQKLLGVVLPCFLEAVRSERERQVVMGVLEALNGVVKSCQGEALKTPGRLAEISHAIRDVLKKKVRGCCSGSVSVGVVEDFEQHCSGRVYNSEWGVCPTRFLKVDLCFTSVE